MLAETDFFSPAERVYFKLARHWMSDASYARWMCRRKFGGGNLDAPGTFNEKLHWLKLHDRRPLYSQLADKYAVREYVRDRIGEEYLNTLYQVCGAPDEIDYGKLPESFVIKATHGSGMNVLVPSREALDERAIAKKLKSWLRTNYYRMGREWVYKDVPPRIVCERFLVDERGEVPRDYKVFCFNGTPRFIQVDADRFSGHARAFYDTNWSRQPFGVMYPLPAVEIGRPDRLGEMLDAAAKLSRSIPFVRVDFYALPRLVFGEMTFYPENGCGIFDPPEWDRALGNLLELPTR